MSRSRSGSGSGSGSRSQSLASRFRLASAIYASSRLVLDSIDADTSRDEGEKSDGDGDVTMGQLIDLT